MRIVKDGGIPDEDALRKDLTAYFRRTMERDRLAAWLSLDGGKPVASAALRIDRARLRAGAGAAASPNNPAAKASRLEGYVMSVYTAPSHRGRGLARTLLDLLLEEARIRNLLRLRLHPTEDGRPLYLKLGFRDFRGTMVLRLPSAGR
ncbi:MAG: GNAT family N-acetyltransferase [Spirochaetaceae bacterium]|nr:GNAT family N-acetyltransferase [Spirochaetaceae bacterium]